MKRAILKFRSGTTELLPLASVHTETAGENKEAGRVGGTELSRVDSVLYFSRLLLHGAQGLILKEKLKPSRETRMVELDGQWFDAFVTLQNAERYLLM